jgi:hypothetical protein
MYHLMSVMWMNKKAGYIKCSAGSVEQLGEPTRNLFESREKCHKWTIVEATRYLEKLTA